MFVAGRHINVTRDGASVALKPGDPCPEAATFPHDVLMRCMKVGQIVNVELPGVSDLPQLQAAQKAAKEAQQLQLAKLPQEAPKPLSTNEKNNPGAVKGRSSTDVKRAKRKAS